MQRQLARTNALDGPWTLSFSLKLVGLNFTSVYLHLTDLLLNSSLDLLVLEKIFYVLIKDVQFKSAVIAYDLLDHLGDTHLSICNFEGQRFILLDISLTKNLTSLLDQELERWEVDHMLVHQFKHALQALCFDVFLPIFINFNANFAH